MCDELFQWQGRLQEGETPPENLCKTDGRLPVPWQFPLGCDFLKMGKWGSGGQEPVVLFIFISYLFT